MFHQVESDFEQRLIAALQPVRGFVLAQVLYHFMDTGIYAALNENDLSVEEMSERLGMNPRRLNGLLQYLANEGFIREDSGSFTLTTKAREMEPFHPWYKLLVGGYAETFQQLGQTLPVDAGYATRSGADVGLGSCGMSRYDALPLTMRLLEPIRASIRTIVDLGCGSGHTLGDLMEELPGVSAIGVDPEPESVRAGQALMAERSLDDRVRMQVAGAEDAPKLDVGSGPVCFSTAFVLQELLEQQGRNAVVNLMREVFTRHRDAYWVVIEVDNRIGDRGAMAHKLAQSYYNPYFLIHYLTEQRLESADFWKELFEEAGAEIVSHLTTDPRVDSTAFELGYLLRAAESRGGQ